MAAQHGNGRHSMITCPACSRRLNFSSECVPASVGQPQTKHSLTPFLAEFCADRNNLGWYALSVEDAGR